MDITTAPMEHQTPGAIFDRCRECRHWRRGLGMGSLGLCELDVQRTWITCEGIEIALLPYPYQRACIKFVRADSEAPNPKGAQTNNGQSGF